MAWTLHCMRDEGSALCPFVRLGVCLCAVCLCASAYVYAACANALRLGNWDNPSLNLNPKL